MSVASKFIETIDTVSQTGDLKERLAETFANIHECVQEGTEDYFSRFRRRTDFTSKSYLSFLSSCKSLYVSQLTKIQGDASHMKESL